MKDYGKIPPDDLHLYNARDVVATRRVREWLEPQTSRYDATWNGIGRSAQHALGMVERWGALLSEDNVRTYDRWLTGRIEGLDQKMAGMGVPKDFNPNSPLQLQKLLFGDLGIKPNPRRITPKGKPQLNADALEEMKDKHPIIPLLLEYKGYRTQKSTFGLGLLKHIGYDGRVHTEYSIVRSGRLGSSAPNLQNQPSPGIKPGETGWEEKRGEDQGVWAKGCWVAPEGYSLVQVDFGQAELRIAAMLAGDEVMAAAFEAEHDFHKMTASASFNVRPEDVTSEQRRISKSTNFALTFGMDEYGLAGTTGLPIQKCKDILNNLFGKYKKFKAWQDREIATAERTGESFVRWNPCKGIDWVHRRNIYQIGEKGIDKTAEKTRKHAKNIALNGPIQTIANYFSLASLVETVRVIEDEDWPAKLVLTVHDSMVAEVRDDRAEEFGRRMQQIMTSFPSGCVKLKADLEIGKNWGELYKVK